MLIRRRATARVAAGAIGAAVFPGERARSQTRPKIRVANLDIGPFVPVAYAAKIAPTFGVDVELSNFRRGLEAAQAVSAGAADVGVGGLEAAISAVAGGAPNKIVAGCTSGAIGWVARKGSGITSVRDLKGKRFAVIRGMHELAMRLEFEKNGLTYSEEPGADVQVFFINNSPGLVSAVRTGNVDASSSPEPFPSRAVQEGYAVPMPPPYDTPLGPLPRALFMRTEYLEKNRDGAQRFMNAYVAAMKTFRDQPQVARDFALNDALKGEITPEDWDSSLKNQKWDVALDDALLQTWADAMLRFRMIRQKLDMKQYADLSLLQAAEKQNNW